jgi:hypothetical protein
MKRVDRNQMKDAPQPTLICVNSIDFLDSLIPPFLAQVDADGNDLDGISDVLLQVPIGTHTGNEFR